LFGDAGDISTGSAALQRSLVAAPRRLRLWLDRDGRRCDERGPEPSGM